MSKLYSNIFLLDDIQNLSSLKDVFTRIYNELMYHVKKDKDQVDKMEEKEKNFIYSWKEVAQIQEIKLPKINNTDASFLEDTILYQKADANLEYSKRKRKDSSGKFLPKSDRVNKVDVELLFFEKEEKVYVLIVSSNEYNIGRVKKLIGEENISSENPEYVLEPDIFNWLFYIYTERNAKLNDTTRLENISGFVGNVTDGANVFTGVSHQTTEMIATKAFISNGGELKKITLRVRDTDADITCRIDENSNSVIDCNASSKLRVLDNTEDNHFFLLYMYGYLIPKLKQLYMIESDNFISNENPKFSKKIGIDVIKSIIEKNNIVFEDLEPFLLKTISEKDLV